MSYCKAALQRISQGPVGKTDGTAKSAAPSILSTFDYRTDDAAATVETAGYFNGAARIFKVGDVTRATMACGGTPVLKSYVVTGNTGTVVTIALQSTAAG